MYASEGNVTICWKIVPEANPTLLKRYTVLALLRPGDEQMKIVGQADGNGTHHRTFNFHTNLYVGRATVEADLVSKILYLRLVNYTSDMENIYCARYEMNSGSNPIRTCHFQAVFLRNTGKHIGFHHFTKNWIYTNLLREKYGAKKFKLGGNQRQRW